MSKTHQTSKTEYEKKEGKGISNFFLFLFFLNPMVLGCTPRPANPVINCPASRPRKEPRVSDRNINDLIERGSYTSEAKGSWSDTPLWMADGRQDVAAVFATEGDYQL